MKFYKELATSFAAAVLCVTLAGTTVLAAGKNSEEIASMKTAAREAISAEAVTANLPANRLLEDTAQAAMEKSWKDAAEEALEQLEKAAEKTEKAAEKESKSSSEAAAAEKAVSEAAEETVKAATEQAVKEQEELEALGLSSDVRVRVTQEELDLLAAIIYCEAGGEEFTGQVAVGAVVLNRVLSTSFENTIYDVIYAPGQFTPAMTGLLDQVLASGASETSYAAARAALNGENPVGDCLYFNSGSGQGIQIGNQHFY